MADVVSYIQSSNHAVMMQGHLKQQGTCSHMACQVLHPLTLQCIAPSPPKLTEGTPLTELVLPQEICQQG